MLAATLVLRRSFENMPATMQQGRICWHLLLCHRWQPYPTFGLGLRCGGILGAMISARAESYVVDPRTRLRGSREAALPVPPTNTSALCQRRSHDFEKQIFLRCGTSGLDGPSAEDWVHADGSVAQVPAQATSLRLVALAVPAEILVPVDDAWSVERGVCPTPGIPWSSLCWATPNDASRHL